MVDERFYYAELDEESICVSVSDLSGEVIMPTMIRITEYDVTLLGKKYVNGVWEEVERPVPEIEPSQLDRIEQNTNEILGNESAVNAMLGVTSYE